MKYIENNIFLLLGGKFKEKALEKKVKQSKGWVRVKELGYLNRKQVLESLSISKAGLVTLHPTPSYIEALPVKMFEYMSAGIPVIASKFPLWQDIVEKNNCGICVNPLAPKEIAKAIEYIINNPKKAEEMGKNGLKAIQEKYNWDIEYKKLLNIYKRLIK
jgi:glycosyltransferase involved in cell wall biosynthesis